MLRPPPGEQAQGGGQEGGTDASPHQRPTSYFSAPERLHPQCHRKTDVTIRTDAA